ncbi:hypothetical protein BGZ61DRAFT_498781 [Ilyonectria robusta]|uniref:uncharacterized protein n=1 Tax=Ilyonectria robusta TaxID=1079257 RepID=UPI001E8DFAFA|nr:uncharacterized protein BGZ61DRAFT_498781 [Ilyonectria robusta]KAH8665679.1 hypothetical protein BGZ61DRAFT_498781 [Ilyonectria robusta]
MGDATFEGTALGTHETLQFQPANTAESPPHLKRRRAYLSCDLCRKIRCVPNVPGRRQPCQRCVSDEQEWVYRSTRSVGRRPQQSPMPMDSFSPPSSVCRDSTNAQGTGNDDAQHAEPTTATAIATATANEGMQHGPSPLEPSPATSNPSARSRIISTQLHNTADALDLLTFTVASEQGRMPGGASLKRRILSRNEAVEYLDFYFATLWPLRPVVPALYRERSQYSMLPVGDPLLLMTLITISSRYYALPGPHGEMRSERIHWQAWRLGQRCLQSALWGSPYTRSPGAIASMLLLIEWHPKSINNPIEFCDEDEYDNINTCPQGAAHGEPGETQSDHATSLTSQQRYGMAALLENLNIVAPGYRSNKMSWMLLSSAIALAQEGCCFDHDQQGPGAQDTLRQQWNQLICGQNEAVRHRFSSTFASLLPDSAGYQSYSRLLDTCLDLEYHCLVMYSFAPASYVLHSTLPVPLTDGKKDALLNLANKATKASHDMLSILINVLGPLHLTRYLPVRYWLFIVAAVIHLLKNTLVVDSHEPEAHENVQLLRDTITGSPFIQHYTHINYHESIAIMGTLFS